MVAKGGAAVGLAALRVPPPPAAVVEVVVGVGISTGFLERFRPRCTWRSQYFWPGTTSLEHRHFFPSVLRQRPGSGSMAARPQYPDCNTDAIAVNYDQIYLILYVAFKAPSQIRKTWNQSPKLDTF
jgi:hypothetical protein